MCFGPSQKASQIESSKEFSKNFMKRHNIPTARFACFTNTEDAVNYIERSVYCKYLTTLYFLRGVGMHYAQFSLQNLGCTSPAIYFKRLP